MITYLEAALLGLLQGFAELFPISSLGHTVIIPRLLGWDIDQASDSFVAFVVLTHLATALVLLAFFWRDWVAIVSGLMRSLRMREIRADDTYARLGWLLVVGTIPAGVLGLLFEEHLKQIFAAAVPVAIVLALNGVALLLVERVARVRADGEAYDDRRIAALQWRQIVGVGLFQSMALVPGFSRTGLTMAGGMLAGGLSRENAVRLSFLLATPIILAAALLKVPDLFAGNAETLGPAVAGAGCSALSAFFSVRFLIRYFETETLKPFGIYCMVAGIVAAAVLIIR